MQGGGVLYNDKKVLLMIHNKEDKLVEATIASVKGLYLDGIYSPLLFIAFTLIFPSTHRTC